MNTPMISVPQKQRPVRERILEAAEAVFAESGYEGATVTDIAARAGLPKSNLHYYFGTKEALYEAVLLNTLSMWDDAFKVLRAEREPADALAECIRLKMELSRTRPNANKVMTGEMLQGAPRLSQFLNTTLRDQVGQSMAVLNHWIELGKMEPVDPMHILLSIWAMTQQYADYNPPIRALHGKDVLDEDDFEAATDSIIRLVLRGCGVPQPAS